MTTLANAISPTSSNTLEAVLFYLIGAVVIASAIGVIVSGSIVRTAVFLLFALIGVAGLFFLLNAEFLAAVQLMIYVGGTLILIIFGVMLTSSSPFARWDARRGEKLLALALGTVLFGALVVAILSAKWTIAPAPGGAYPLTKLGTTLLGEFLFPFELASVMLLVVMIGAAYLAKRRREMITLQHYLVLAAALFVCGLVTMVVKRNAIAVLIGVELILNAAAINLVAFNRYSFPGTAEHPALSGEVFTLFIIVIAAAEAAVALAIFLNFYNSVLSIDLESGQKLKG